MNHFVEDGKRKEEHVSAFIEENLTIMCYLHLPCYGRGRALHVLNAAFPNQDINLKCMMNRVKRVRVKPLN